MVAPSMAREGNGSLFRLGLSYLQFEVIDLIKYWHIAKRFYQGLLKYIMSSIQLNNIYVQTGQLKKRQAFPEKKTSILLTLRYIHWNKEFQCLGKPNLNNRNFFNFLNKIVF